MEKDVEKEYVGGQKKAKGNLDWNGMKKQNLAWKRFLDSIYVFPRKRYASNSYLTWKKIDSWHIVSEIIFVFHPFMQQRQIVDVIAVWKGVEADKLAI